MAIPHIIHQIWMQGFDQLPMKYVSNVQSVIDKNPGWEHRHWDEKSIQSLMDSIGGDIQSKYSKFIYLHQKVDFARYVILYTYGGVSVDVDCVAIRGFDSTPGLDTSDLIVSQSTGDSIINNATILSSVNNAYLKGFIDSIDPVCKFYQTKALCIAYSAGVVYFSNYVKSHPGDITILDNSYFEPCSGNNKYCTIKDNTILDHQHEGSWMPMAFVKFNELYYFFKAHQFIVLSLIALVILTLLNRRKK